MYQFQQPTLKMTPREELVLKIIGSKTHNLTDIARVAGIDKTNASHVLNILAWHKLIKNSECKECGRKGKWIVL